MQLWDLTLRGSPHDTLADFYDALMYECRETQSKKVEVEMSSTLPLFFLASLLHKYGCVPFETSGFSDEDIHTRLVQYIF